MPNLNRRRFYQSFKSATWSQRGQVVIEYVLLVIITVGLAALIMRTMVRRSTDDPGFLIAKWQNLLEQIGADDPQKRSP